MVAWDVAIAGYLFFWLTGLIAELQRSDAIALDRFLHLPVSPRGAFLINYLGSSVSLSLGVMLPTMTGLTAGLAASRGPRLLLVLPLVLAFFLMMTAVTYQFRGWLASMMASPRRRRAILAVLPILFIVAVQLPNLVHMLSRRQDERQDGRVEAPVRTPFGRDSLRDLNVVLPPGWLAYGAAAVADGRTWPALAAIGGMGLIGGLSLRRAYRTTLRLYTGDFNRDRPRPGTITPATSSVSSAPRARVPFVARRLPWTSDRVAGMALAGFRSWLRAPEMKMALLTPVLMLLLFTGMFRNGVGDIELLQPLRTAGIVGFLLVMAMLGPVGNQFAYDRAGFRAFVLSPAPRRDVLVAKNLANLPFALLTMGLAIGMSQWFQPLRLDHLGGLMLQAASMYVLFCLSANLLSIFGPIALKPGSGMPAKHQGLRTLYPLAFVVLVPIPMALTMIPLGIEALFIYMGWLAWLPAYLVFGAVQAGAAVWLYRMLIGWEGTLLQRREQRILEVVSARTQ
jgi:hypothetical protein